MTIHSLKLTVLSEMFAVCRLDAAVAVPTWATTGSFPSIMALPRNFPSFASRWSSPMASSASGIGGATVTPTL